MNTFIVAEEHELEYAVRQAATESGTVAYAGRTYHFVDSHEEEEIKWLIKCIKNKKPLAFKRSSSMKKTMASEVSPLLELSRKKK